jgi:hypothetical protein
MERLARQLTRLLVAVSAVGTCMSGVAQATNSLCGNPFQNHFGPWDYRSAPPDKKRMVEQPHFPLGVETLTKPSKTTFGMMAQDVGYTLRVFPNHHRALITMSRLADRHKTDEPPGARFTLNCYFERAVRFAPDDTVARLLYAQYLGKKGEKDNAKYQITEAIRFAGDNALSNHNIGLVAFDLGLYDIAVSQAKKVASLGDAREDLVARLRSANRWPADTPPTTNAGASAPLSPASEPKP